MAAAFGWVAQLRLWWHHVVTGEADWMWATIYTWSRIIRREPETEAKYERVRLQARAVVAVVLALLLASIGLLILAAAVG